MYYLLMLFSDFTGVTSTSLQNRVAKRNLKNALDPFLYTALTALFTMLALMLGTTLLCPIFGPYFFVASGYTLWLGMAFGLVVAVSGLLVLLALACGPMSLTTLITSCLAMLIPTLVGVFGLIDGRPEGIQTVQWIGLILLVAALCLMMNPKIDRRITPKWCLLVVTSGLLSGTVGILQKVHQKSEFAAQRPAFLTVAFATYCVVQLLVLLGLRLKKQEKPTIRLKSTVTLVAAVVGTCTATVHLLNLFLSGVMPSVIFFPLVNGISVLLSGMSGVILFKERLLKQQVVGYALGLAAMLLIGGILKLFG